MAHCSGETLDLIDPVSGLMWYGAGNRCVAPESPPLSLVPRARGEHAGPSVRGGDLRGYQDGCLGLFASFCNCVSVASLLAARAHPTRLPVLRRTGHSEGVCSK